MRKDTFAYALDQIRRTLKTEIKKMTIAHAKAYHYSPTPKQIEDVTAAVSIRVPDYLKNHKGEYLSEFVEDEVRSRIDEWLA